MIIPNTGQRLVHGDIVSLARVQGMKWIVQYGWYTYYNQKHSGWYFSSIPGNTVIPVTDADLQSLTVISTNGSNSHNCFPPVHPSFPPVPPVPPSLPPIPSVASELLDRAMLTVDTIAQRNALGSEFLPNGKVIRVNDVEGEVKYYEWKSSILEWKETTLGATISSIEDLPADMVETSSEGLSDNDKVIPTSKAVKAAINEVSGLEWGSIQ